MQRYAFKMHLDPGKEAEYRARHDAIWPELKTLLREAGIANYSIHLDRETHTLFAYLERRDGHAMAGLSSHPVMRRWWAHMRDVMTTKDDGAPVAEELTEVFHMA